MISPTLFQALLLSWFQQYGRKNLPWQHPRTPYRVWVSEVMLQQTQVSTVIPYFERFMDQFPTIEMLANADQDTVLHLWAGLGYYARARNLHRAAQKIMEDFGGEFPYDIKSLQSLPGIGRSTAGAIMSLGFNKPAAILDGNVKRLLCRLHAIEGWPGDGKVMKALWTVAEQYISFEHPSDYTQAMMDFGTLVCTKQRPDCERCPFMQHCIAYQNHQIQEYPQAKPNRSLPTRTTYFLVLINDKQEVLLEKRPPVGIWGGLWSVPEYTSDVDLNMWCEKNYGCIVKSISQRTTIQHTFSHFRLAMQPIVLYVEASKSYTVQDRTPLGWFKQTECSKKGLAAPIKKLLKQVFEQSSENSS